MASPHEKARDNVDTFASTEKKAFDRVVSGSAALIPSLEQAANFPGKQEITQDEFELVAEAYERALANAIDLLNAVDRATTIGGKPDKDLHDQTLYYVREEVKKALRDTLDDKLIVERSIPGKTPQEIKVPVKRLQLQRFFEARLELAQKLQQAGATTGTTQDGLQKEARKLYLQLVQAPAVHYVEKIRNEVQDLKTSHSFLELPPVSNFVLPPAVANEIQKLAEDYQDDLNLTTGRLPIFEPTFMADLNKKLYSGEGDPTTPLTARELQRLKDIHTVVQEANNGTFRGTGSVNHLTTHISGSTLTWGEAVEKVLDQMIKLAELRDPIEGEGTDLTGDPIYEGWKQMVEQRTRVAGLPLEDFLKTIQSKIKAGTVDADDVANLEYAQQALVETRDTVQNPGITYADQEFGQALQQNQERYLEGQIEGVRELIGEARVAAGVDTEGTPEVEKTPHKLMEAFLAFYKKATSKLVGIIKTNPNYGSWPPDIQEAWKEYQAMIPSDAEAATDPEWAHALQLISNTGSSWEYIFAATKSRKESLIHDQDKVEIFVDPQRWRQIFNRYGLLEYTETAVGTLKAVEYPSDPTAPDYMAGKEGIQKGPFWEMWQLAIDTSINPSSTDDERYSYGDNLLNNADEFYEYVVNKYLSTPSGAALRARFADEAEWQLVKIQIKDMFDIGNLFDDIYAVIAAWGGSISHVSTTIDCGGTKLPLWAVVHPVHYSSYLANNSVESMTHMVMNTSLASEQAILDMLSQHHAKFADSHGHMPEGTHEMYHDTTMYVNGLLDANEVLHKLDKVDHFPNFARSVLQHGLPIASRYFRVDAPGWGQMWDMVLKPFNENEEPINEDKAIELIADFTKGGIGRAKLVKNAVPPEVFTDISKLLFVRVAAGFKGNPNVAVGRKWIAPMIPLMHAAPRGLQSLRKQAVERIKIATTISHHGSDGTAFKRDLMEIWGADFAQDTGTDVTPQVIKGEAPDYLLFNFRRQQVAEYVVEMWNKHHYRDLQEIVIQLRKKTAAAFSEEGLLPYFHSPYMLKKKDKAA